MNEDKLKLRIIEFGLNNDLSLKQLEECNNLIKRLDKLKDKKE